MKSGLLYAVLSLKNIESNPQKRGSRSTELCIEAMKLVSDQSGQIIIPLSFLRVYRKDLNSKIRSSICTALAKEHRIEYP